VDDLCPQRGFNPYKEGGWCHISKVPYKKGVEVDRLCPRWGSNPGLVLLPALPSSLMLRSHVLLPCLLTLPGFEPHCGKVKVNLTFSSPLTLTLALALASRWEGTHTGLMSRLSPLTSSDPDPLPH